MIEECSDESESSEEVKRKKRKRNVRRGRTEKDKSPKKTKSDTIGEKSVICLIDPDDVEGIAFVKESPIASKNRNKEVVKQEIETDKMQVKPKVKGFDNGLEGEAVEIDSNENNDDDADIDAIKYLKVSVRTRLQILIIVCQTTFSFMATRRKL